MSKVIFVIGATAAGKTYYIQENYSDKEVDILNVYDYQQRVYEEFGYSEKIPFHEQFRCLMEANNRILKDMIDKLKEGRDVVVEHTLYKAKRRIAYIDAIREAVINVTIEIYVICPGESLWRSNLEKRELLDSFECKKRDAEEIEFPNPVEGFDAIYEVVDGVVLPRWDKEKREIVEQAKRELMEESVRINEENEKKQKRKELIESMNTRPFWHYCEVCGKKEYLTAQQAFDCGWDYPPTIGVFGLLSPRTCGSCGIEDTLYMKVMAQEIPIVFDSMLTQEELVTWNRIKGEPESLLVEEK